MNNKMTDFTIWLGRFKSKLCDKQAWMYLLMTTWHHIVTFYERARIRAIMYTTPDVFGSSDGGLSEGWKWSGKTRRVIDHSERHNKKTNIFIPTQKIIRSRYEATLLRTPWFVLSYCITFTEEVSSLRESVVHYEHDFVRIGRGGHHIERSTVVSKSATVSDVLSSFSSATTSMTTSTTALSLQSKRGLTRLPKVLYASLVAITREDGEIDPVSAELHEFGEEVGDVTKYINDRVLTIPTYDRNRPTSSSSKESMTIRELLAGLPTLSSTPLAHSTPKPTILHVVRSDATKAFLSLDDDISHIVVG